MLLREFNRTILCSQRRGVAVSQC